MDHKPVSLANQVFEQLENDILSGKYKRGEVLTELTLCQSLGVSRTPVREALRRLSQEHLIEEISRGNLVLGIDRKDLEDIYTIRQAIEPLTAAMAAVNATDDELKEMKETIELQEFYLQKNDPLHIRQMDSEFHRQLYAASHRTVLFDTLMPLHKKVQKYRKLSVEDHGRAAISVSEHAAILAAVISRNKEKARDAMSCHIANAYDSIMREEHIQWD